MLKQVLENVVSDNDKMFLDCTLGEGGHTEAVLKNFPQINACGLDRDSNIMSVAKSRMQPFGDRFQCFQMNFAESACLKDNVS
jgi:16S rRNA (cytosine1402-N4)-methyltransferase